MDTSKTNKQIMLDKYLNQLEPHDRKAYEIAKDHLKSSFNLEKSIGFIKWLKKENNK